MMCSAMRERMLDAEMDELEGRGTSLVATHVRECEACAAIARGIVRDTRVLAVVASRESFAGAGAGWGRDGAFLMIGAAAIAASVMILVMPGANPATPPVVALGPVVAQPVSSVPQPAPELNRVAGRAIAPRAFAAAEPVAAVPVAAEPLAARTTPTGDRASVTVDPPPGMHAVVMQGSNPSITVVWMYSDTQR